MARDIVISRFVGVAAGYEFGITGIPDLSGRLGYFKIQIAYSNNSEFLSALAPLALSRELLRVEIALDKRLPGFFRTAAFGHGGSALDQHSCKRAKIPSIP